VDKTPVDKTPASTVRVAATVTSVDVIGAALVRPVGALEQVTGKDVDGVGHPHRHRSRTGPPARRQSCHRPQMARKMTACDELGYPRPPGLGFLLWS
jgi:hypothetical protein